MSKPTLEELKAVTLEGVDDKWKEMKDWAVSKENEKEKSKNPVLVMMNPSHFPEYFSTGLIKDDGVFGDDLRSVKVVKETVVSIIEEIIDAPYNLIDFVVEKDDGSDVRHLFRTMYREDVEHNVKYTQLVGGVLVYDDTHILLLDTGVTDKQTGQNLNRVKDKLTMLQGHVDSDIVTIHNSLSSAIEDTLGQEISEELVIDEEKIKPSSKDSVILYDTGDAIGIEHVGVIEFFKYEGSLKEDLENGLIGSGEPEKHKVKLVEIDRWEDHKDRFDGWVTYISYLFDGLRE